MRPLANLRVISSVGNWPASVLITMDSDEKLIYMVQKYQCLFNPNVKNYNSKHSKNNAWQKISWEMKLPVPECQKQWKKLRDCYKKALKLRQLNGVKKTKKPIKFEKELEFLKPHLQDRPQTSNLDCSDNSIDVRTEEISIKIEPQTSDVGECSRSDSELSNHIARNKTLPLSQELSRQYGEAKGNEDPLDAFFLSMSKSVKKMPVRIQAELKRAILGLVTDAEVNLASEESTQEQKRVNWQVIQ